MSPEQQQSQDHIETNEMPVLHSRSLIEAAQELGKPVDQVTAVDLLDYETEDLPDGPPSDLGGEVPGYQINKSESETRRVAAIGKAWVDAVVAADRDEEKPDDTPSK